MITISFVVAGDASGFDMDTANKEIARAIHEHKLSNMRRFSASRMYGRELWRVTVAFGL